MAKRTRKFSKAEIIRERWLRGRLRYKEHAGQKLIRAAFENSKPNQLFVGECSRQFGKTIFEGIIALECAFRKPHAKVKIGTAFQTDLLEFIIPAFDFVLQDCPLDLRPVWKSQHSKYVLPHNGSEIKLIGLDRKPNGLRGTLPDLMILSEAGFISNLHYLYKSIIIPGTTHRPDCRVVMLTTPPSTPAHEFLDYVAKAEVEGGYIKLTIYHNPLLSQETIDRLMKESGGSESTTWKREYLCEHVTDANLQIITEWKDEYWKTPERDEYFPFYHRYTSMDLGVRDNTAILFGHYDYQRATLMIEDEVIANGPTLTTHVIHSSIIQKEKDLWGLDEFGQPHKVYKRISDNNNPLLIQDLSLIHKMHFTQTDKARLEEMVNAVKMMVRNGSILVHERCKNLRGCLKYGVWDKRRDKFAKADIFGHYDALAALIYMVRNLDKSSNPIPYTFKVDHMNQFVRPEVKDPGNMGILKGALGLK